MERTPGCTGFCWVSEKLLCIFEKKVVEGVEIKQLLEMEMGDTYNSFSARLHVANFLPKEALMIRGT